jgi:hypothetical protein
MVRCRDPGLVATEPASTSATQTAACLGSFPTPLGLSLDEKRSGDLNGRRQYMMPLGNAPALMTVSADDPPGFHVALALHVDEPYRLRDEVVAQELPGRTRDLDLV